MGNPKPTPIPSLPIDEHVMEEGCRLELIDGQQVVTPPAQEPHGRKHSELDYLLRAHVTGDFLVAVDMLTRAAQDQDFAPDVSVYPKQRDDDGRQKLDELSFEIVGEQPMSIATRKASVLVERGVRRVFAVQVESKQLLEWDAQMSLWVALPGDSFVRDRCFVRPLPVSAILDAADADDAVFDALRAKGNPALMDFAQASFDRGIERGLAHGRTQGREEGREEGLVQGLRQAVRDLCEVLSVPLTDERNATLEEADRATLEALVSSLKQLRRWP